MDIYGGADETGAERTRLDCLSTMGVQRGSVEMNSGCVGVRQHEDRTLGADVRVRCGQAVLAGLLLVCGLEPTAVARGVLDGLTEHDFALTPRFK